MDNKENEKVFWKKEKWKHDIQNLWAIPRTVLKGKCVYIYVFCICVCVQACTCSVMSNSATPWTAAHQAPLSLGFSRQEYWSGLPFPSPEDLPNPGIEPTSSAPPALAVRLFTTEHLGSPCVCVKLVTCKIWWTDFPAGPVAKTSPCESRAPRFNPWSRH